MHHRMLSCTPGLYSLDAQPRACLEHRFCRESDDTGQHKGHPVCLKLGKYPEALAMNNGWGAQPTKEQAQVG